MNKIAICSLFFLTACDPGGTYADFKCVERDVPTGRCTKAEYSCERQGKNAPSYPMLTWNKYEGARCM